MFFSKIVKVLEDKTRKRAFSNDSLNRKIVISIFYPTNEVNKEAKYEDLYNPKKEIFINQFTRFNVEENYLHNLNVNIIHNAPLYSNQELHPVIIFSPGFGLDRDMIIYCIESLLSAGYIVITIGHVFDTMFTIFPDGEVTFQSRELHGVRNNDFKKYQQFIQVRKDDILFVLDELNKINNDDPILNNKLNLKNIGVLGHSLGGVAAFEAACCNKGIKAGVILDGAFCYLDLNERIENNMHLDIPFVSIRQDNSTYESMKESLINEAKKEVRYTDELYMKIQEIDLISKKFRDGQINLNKFLTSYKSFIKIKNTNNLSFTDFPVLLNKDKSQYDKVYEIINEVNIRFFNEFLIGNKDEYTEFINNNNYEDLCIIDEEGKII